MTVRSYLTHHFFPGYRVEVAILQSSLQYPVQPDLECRVKQPMLPTIEFCTVNKVSRIEEETQ